MCLWLPQFAHHNTIIMENEEQLQSFRPVTVSSKRRAIVMAPYVPHHNTVVISKKSVDSPLADEKYIDNKYMDEKYMDEQYMNEKYMDKKHPILQLENGGFKRLEQEKQVEAFKNDIVKSTKSNLLLVKAE
jgi:hypothetical protein